MHEWILDRLRKCVRTGNFVVTLHADEELADEGLSILDVERAILGGRVIERQKDADTAEWKYIVAGPDSDNETISVVVKLGPTGKMVLITVFGDES
jgi:hypothetical protein